MSKRPSVALSARTTPDAALVRLNEYRARVVLDTLAYGIIRELEDPWGFMEKLWGSSADIPAHHAYDEITESLAPEGMDLFAGTDTEERREIVHRAFERADDLLRAAMLSDSRFQAFTACAPRAPAVENAGSAEGKAGKARQRKPRKR